MHSKAIHMIKIQIVLFITHIKHTFQMFCF